MLDENALPRKKKKLDHEALQSPLSRIPGMNLATVRDLLDLGVRQVYDLVGRSPEALMDEIRQNKPEVPDDRLWALRMAVYYAETDEPDARMMHITRWRQPLS